VKKLLATVAVLGLAATAYASVIRSWSVVTTSTTPFSGTVPTADCGQARSGTASTGLWLASCTAYYVCIEAASGQTLSGAGSLRAEFWDPELGAQTRAGGSDETLDSTASGVRRFCFPQHRLEPGSTGCGYWTPVAVTTSGGATVTTSARCLQ
jgi:hypothetical protein